LYCILHCEDKMEEERIEPSSLPSCKQSVGFNPSPIQVIDSDTHEKGSSKRPRMQT
jgi:hypothetical protein